MNAIPFKALLIAGLMAGSGFALAANDGQVQVNGLLSTDGEYRNTWTKVVKHEERLPEWVMNLSGTSPQQMTLKEQARAKYLVGPLCESAQGCDHERLIVAFSWDKDEAYGLLANVPQRLPADTSPKQTQYRWLGEPDEGMQQLLKEQL
jgi:hypothetical protein